MLILPLIGIWVMVSTLRAGLAHQRLARLVARRAWSSTSASCRGCRPGRIQRDAADALFETVRAELESDPDNWLRWYRLARAYDYAGDRSRARETMKKAVEMQEGREQDAADSPPHSVAAHAGDVRGGAGRCHRPRDRGRGDRAAACAGATLHRHARGGRLLFGTTANLGYMSGALKHAFDICYYPCLDATRGPVGLYIHGNKGTEGAEGASPPSRPGWLR